MDDRLETQYDTFLKFAWKPAFGYYSKLMNKPTEEILAEIKDSLAYYEETDKFLSESTNNKLYDLVSIKFGEILPRISALKGISDELKKGQRSHLEEAIGIMSFSKATCAASRFYISHNPEN